MHEQRLIVLFEESLQSSAKLVLGRTKKPKKPKKPNVSQAVFSLS